MEDIDIGFIFTVQGAIMGAIVSGVIGILGWWLKKRSQTKTEHKDIVDEQSKAIWRLQKTIIILAKIMDDQVARAHPELQTELEGIAKELLDNDNTD